MDLAGCTVVSFVLSYLFSLLFFIFQLHHIRAWSYFTMRWCIASPPPCTSHLFVPPMLYLLKRTRQIDQYSNSIFQTYFCPNSIFRPRAVHIFSLEQGKRKILTLIEFYWISSFPAWAPLYCTPQPKPISVHLYNPLTLGKAYLGIFIQIFLLKDIFSGKM